MQPSSGFQPNQEALSMLRDMGYPMDDCVLALRICDNNLENACTFLLSNPNPSESMPASALRQQQVSVGLGNSNQQQVSVGYATQLAQQTQQRTQALFQDVSRLEQAINQLVQ